MPSLSRDLRKSLEKVSAKARAVAEEAAEKALKTLAVGDRKAHDGMTDKKQTALRNRLRAHGRQLGDKRNVEKDTQTIDHLVSECAYEQWHRMLFARFLAENGLLIEPESGAAVSVEEVKQLARSRSQDWVALAGEFAVRMLPQVFRQGDPVLDVQFAPEDRRRLEDLLLSLPEAVFVAGDALGWCYQFWQAERKDEINASGDKIGADELPAVTQLFTEDYMVDFLLDNTLGAWHAAKALAAKPELAATTASEDELRQAVAVPHCSWKYLRFIKSGYDQWTPAAGTFDGWPTMAKELKCLDPCMGSGHFVVAMFERLVALRIAEESLTHVAAVDAVIRDNLFGLEIDPRCTQISAFNLALAAWRRVGYRSLPAMNLACSGLAPNSREADWLAIAGGNERLRSGIARLYSLFKDAPVLGSLINPRAAEGDLLEAGFDELQPLLETALAQEAEDAAAHEMAVTARGLAKAADVLAGQFTLVATNVPYLGRPKQDKVLMDYCEQAHPKAKADLATCFVERCVAFCSAEGVVAVVTPQNWLFLGRYKSLRETLLQQATWSLVGRLGTGAFETISGEIVNVALLILNRLMPASDAALTGLDVSDRNSPREKGNELIVAELFVGRQASQRSNPDSAIVLEARSDVALLDRFGNAWQGIATSDVPRFQRAFWEVAVISKEWQTLQSTVDSAIPFGGREAILLWENGFGAITEVCQAGAAFRGKAAWGKRGVVISQMNDLAPTLYSGDKFDCNCAVITLSDEGNLPALWCYVESGEYTREVRKVNKKLNVTNSVLAKIPFDVGRWHAVAAVRYPNGLPKPSSSDPTQWLFNGDASDSDHALHVVVARLLGYQWPRQTGSRFLDCQELGKDGLEELADDEGIVSISPAMGEGPADERLRELLARAYGKGWNADRQKELLAQATYSGDSLADWLRNGFFEQHCVLFHHCPFIWHIWDGLSDGFQALVNYHKLAGPNGEGRRTLQKLTFACLGEWIALQKAEQKAGKEGAAGKLASAIHLKVQLESILEGEPPYDLFVRWKPLRDQAIGWDPDINDGVRLNIRPFMNAETLNGKSIFRKEPKIKNKWNKDRGKEPERSKQDFPWFWSWGQEAGDFMGNRTFDGNRWNDLHYSNSAKLASRAAHKGKKR